MSRTEAAPLAVPDAARLFGALGDSTRLELVARLSEGGARSIAQMREGLAISRQAVTKHLGVLLDAGLVHRTKSGREVYFALDREAFNTARDWLEVVGAQWDATLERLKFLVENEP